MNETRYRRPLIGMAPAAFIWLIFLLSPDPTLRWLAFVIVVLSRRVTLAPSGLLRPMEMPLPLLPLIVELRTVTLPP